MSLFRFADVDSIPNTEKVVRPAWSGNVTTMNTFFLPSYIDTDDYVNVFKDSDSNPSSTPQFSITYAHIDGSGSVKATGDGTLSNRLIYGQLRSLLLQTESGSFAFNQDGSSSKDFFAIALGRNQYRERIRNNSINIKLSNGGNSISLTDYSAGGTEYVGTNKYYFLVSGSNGVMASGSSIYNTPAGAYGWVFPNKGLILLNPSALTASVSNKGIGMTLITSGATRSNNNANKLFDALKNNSFSAQSEESVTSRIFQATINMDECNYTTNPTIIGPDGSLIYQTLIDNPETFITTIGLYNDTNELLAVAKSSIPIRKNSVTKPTFQIKLSW